MASNSSALRCLGCGQVTKATDRRSLTSSEGRVVAEVWRELVNLEGLQLDVQLLDSRHPMCRKCFNSYKTVHKYQQAIRCNLRNAAVVLESSQRIVSAPSPKRPRLSQFRSRPSSPDVAVGIVQFEMIYSKVRTTCY